MTNIALCVLAAVLEIAGCFAFWVWVRRGAAPWVVVLGIASLVGFALALTRVDSAFAGRGLRRVRWHLHRSVTRVAVGRGTAGPNQDRRIGCSASGRRRVGDHRVRRPSTLSEPI
jgi:hypothetical protein